MSLNVTIPDTFNGPLGLLHSLIIRDEIDIYDIPIAKLTASYCEEIERMEVINIDEGAEFLDLASRLKDIKLRMLLPPDELPEGEEDEDGDLDPRSGLVEALLEYRRFKDAARVLGDLADEQSRRFGRIAPRMQFRIVEEPDDDADSLSLFLAMQNMLSRLAAPEVIESHEIPVSTRIEQIMEVLVKRDRTRFSLLLSTAPDRREMVGFFVALLELIRRRQVTARQSGDFSDIIIERRDESVADARRHGVPSGRRRCPAVFPVAAPRKVRREKSPPRAVPAAFPLSAPCGAVRPARVRRVVPGFPVSGRTL